ncbi:hypothetical protein B0H13DRAFT_2091990 [Mycena leptocephala]|nr:hypothetical protein B0H13DRAFT_2091990 [Mycena leptocephala]
MRVLSLSNHCFPPPSVYLRHTLAYLLVAVAALLACAFTIAVPTNPTSGEHESFDLKAIIGGNLRTDFGQIHTLPTLPAVGGYSLNAVNAENVDFILAASLPFAITA